MSKPGTPPDMSPSPEPLIRSIEPAEAGLFWELRLRALREHPEAFLSSLEEDAARPLEEVRARLEAQAPARHRMLGAWLADRLVGMAGVNREHFQKAAHRATLWGMYVAPEARGQGIGKRLLTEAIATARRMAGVEQLYLAVIEGNTQARALYVAAGFEPYGVMKQAVRVGDRYYDEELMVLRLPAAG